MNIGVSYYPANLVILARDFDKALYLLRAELIELVELANIKVC